MLTHLNLSWAKFMLTFRQFLLEQDEKPKINYKGISGNNEHHFHITHPSLEAPASVRIDHSNEDPKIGYINISHSGKDGHFMGNLGHRNVRYAMGRIKHHLPPSIESLHSAGARTTGSKSKGIEELGSIVSIKHVKPIPPDNE